MEKLSRELLLHIGSYLTQEDLSACVETCHAWNNAFIPLLYKSVTFRSQKQLSRFCHTLHTKKNRARLGQHVRKLVIAYKAQEDELDHLPLICPYVTEIDIGQRLLAFTEHVATTLEEWKDLKKLSLLIDLRKPIDFSIDFLANVTTTLEANPWTNPGWINQAAGLKCVRSLSIVGTADNEEMLSVLERVCKVFPELEELSFVDCLLGKNMPSNIKIEPCKTVRALSFKAYDATLWPRYLAEKFPNVESIVAGFYGNTNESAREGVLELVKAYPQLKYLRTDHDCDWRKNKQFVEKLREIGAPLADLNLDQWSAEACVKAINDFQGSLTKVECYPAKGGPDVLRKILKSLQLCRSLVELELTVCGTDVEIDYLLNTCRHLEKLRIEWPKIVKVGNDTGKGNLHPLKELYLQPSIVEDPVYPYLVQNCPGLVKMSIDYLDSTFTRRQLNLNFPSRSLKYLAVLHVEPMLYKLRQTNKESSNGEDDEPLTRWFNQYQYGEWDEEFDHLHCKELKPRGIYKPKSYMDVMTITCPSLVEFSTRKRNFAC
ncbi:hypothetical protein EC973_007662 [Apophysomyces ossiformis]|uniref:F-box domain-containing protein n=1 Tax=Apophysomyces ossiformis TaxID=679940 RepID=A0A8H7BTV5_9FUNG|nr:hypothetical protein EC973_007662 [Apophysomyces ossiformis]